MTGKSAHPTEVRCNSVWPDNLYLCHLALNQIVCFILCSSDRSVGINLRQHRLKRTDVTSTGWRRGMSERICHAIHRRQIGSPRNASARTNRAVRSRQRHGRPNGIRRLRQLPQLRRMRSPMPQRHQHRLHRPAQLRLHQIHLDRAYRSSRQNARPVSALVESS